MDLNKAILEAEGEDILSLRDAVVGLPDNFIDFNKVQDRIHIRGIKNGNLDKVVYSLYITSKEPLELTLPQSKLNAGYNEIQPIYFSNNGFNYEIHIDVA